MAVTWAAGYFDCARPQTEEGEYAVACKDAEQSDLSTDAEEGEDEEEEAKEMLDVNALD